MSALVWSATGPAYRPAIDAAGPRATGGGPLSPRNVRRRTSGPAPPWPSPTRRSSRRRRRRSASARGIARIDQVAGAAVLHRLRRATGAFRPHRQAAGGRLDGGQAESLGFQAGSARAYGQSEDVGLLQLAGDLRRGRAPVKRTCPPRPSGGLRSRSGSSQRAVADQDQLRPRRRLWPAVAAPTARRSSRTSKPFRGTNRPTEMQRRGRPGRRVGPGRNTFRSTGGGSRKSFVRPAGESAGADLLGDEVGDGRQCVDLVADPAQQRAGDRRTVAHQVS